MVGKYLSVFKTKLKLDREYKLDLIGHFIKMPVQAGILAAVWIAIFNATGSSTIAGFTLPTFLIYIISAQLMISSFHDWAVYENQEELIVYGGFVNILVRPMNYLWYSFAQSIQIFFRDCLFSSATILLVTFIGSKMSKEILFPSVMQIGLFLFAFALGLILAYLIYYNICLAMFWVGDVWSVWAGVESIEALLSGAVVPLTINSTFNAIASFLPFKYLISTPLMTYLGKYTIVESLTQLGYSILWIFGLALLSRLILKAGLKKTDVQGG